MHLATGSAPLMQSGPDIIVDAPHGEVSRDGATVRLSKMQMEFFLLLCKRPGRVISRDAAMFQLYQLRDDEPGFKVLDVMICKMRKRIAPLAIKIKTTWGRGWSIDVDGARIEIERDDDDNDHDEAEDI